MLPSNQNSGGCPEAEYDVEFRAYNDDAWYSVRVVGDGEKLTIKYCNFSDEHDNVFEVKNFTSSEELVDFEGRFRPVSVQLQDRECSKVFEGMRVCASHYFNESDVRFYDAVVEEVNFKEHSFANGEEECLCTFLLFWQHGSNAGNLTVEKIENICLSQCTVLMEPTLASFIKLVRNKIESASCKSGSVLNSSVPTYNDGAHCEEKGHSIIKNYSTFAQRLIEVGRICNLSERQDTDVGGIGNYYIMLIENLDKELSPSTIVEFIHKQTSISCQAFTFPSLSSESYTRGAIVLDCEKDLNELYAFIENPNDMIMSSRGRPWVVTERMARHDTLRSSIGTLMLKSQNRISGIGNELKVISSGSEEYRTAKQLRDLYMEFAEHQQRLHKRLAMEERNILQLSRSV